MIETWGFVVRLPDGREIIVRVEGAEQEAAERNLIALMAPEATIADREE